MFLFWGTIEYLHLHWCLPQDSELYQCMQIIICACVNRVDCCALWLFQIPICPQTCWTNNICLSIHSTYIHTYIHTYICTRMNACIIVSSESLSQWIFQLRDQGWNHVVLCTCGFVSPYGVNSFVTSLPVSLRMLVMTLNAKKGVT